MATGYRKTVKEAAKWYRKAAKQGDDNAQHNLRTMYSERDDDDDDYSFSDYIADNYDGNYQMFEDNFPYND